MTTPDTAHGTPYTGDPPDDRWCVICRSHRVQHHVAEGDRDQVCPCCLDDYDAAMAQAEVTL